MNLMNELKLNNKIGYKAYFLVSIIVVILNVLMNLEPGKLVIYTEFLIGNIAYPQDLFKSMLLYLNIPLTLLFIIPLIIDYSTSVLELGLLGGKINFNKAILQKMKTSSIVTLVLFLITAVNGYIIYISEVDGRLPVISIGRVMFSLAVPLIFIISLTIFLIIVMKGNGFAVAISIGYYLIVDRFYPILDIIVHLNKDMPFGAILYKQLIQLVVSIILLTIALFKIKRCKI